MSVSNPILDIPKRSKGKSKLQVPDTGTRVLENTRPFWRSSIVCFWMPPARSKERKYHISGQYWYTRNVPVFTNTGTFQYLGPEVYFFRNFNKLIKSSVKTEGCIAFNLSSHYTVVGLYNSHETLWMGCGHVNRVIYVVKSCFVLHESRNQLCADVLLV